MYPNKPIIAEGIYDQVISLLRAGIRIVPQSDATASDFLLMLSGSVKNVTNI